MNPEINNPAHDKSPIYLGLLLSLMALLAVYLLVRPPAKGYGASDHNHSGHNHSNDCR